MYDLHQDNRALELVEWWQTVAAVHRSVARCRSQRWPALPGVGDQKRAPRASARRHAALFARHGGAPFYAVLPDNATVMGSAVSTEAAAQAGIPPSLLPACVWLLGTTIHLVRVKGV